MQYLLTEKEIYPFRPKPFFFLNTDKKEEYVYEKAEKSLSEMKDCGFSGFILFNKPPTGFDKEGYLSDTWFFAVENFAKAAKKLSLEMWINDGYDYPPGAVGGKVFDKLAAPCLVLIDDLADGVVESLHIFHADALAIRRIGHHNAAFGGFGDVLD